MTNHEEHVVLIGSYTEPVPHAPYAAGPGIITLLVTDNNITEVCRTGAPVTGANPSYICNEGEDVYVANETQDGTITRLRVDRNGGLSFVYRAKCGKDPCHVSIVDNGVVAGCFGDGSVWSYMIDRDGLRVGDVWTCDGGRGVHQALPVGDGRILVCNPVGGMLYLLSRSREGKLGVLKTLRLDGYPRHGVVDNDTVLVACAKAREVLRVDIEKLVVLSKRKIGDGDGVLGAIRKVDNGVMVSERGDGNDRIWWIGEDEKIRWWWSGGRVPRDFDVRAGVVLAVHQRCGNVSIGEMDGGGNGVIKMKAMQLAGNEGTIVCTCFLDSTKIVKIG